MDSKTNLRIIQFTSEKRDEKGNLYGYSCMPAFKIQFQKNGERKDFTNLPIFSNMNTAKEFLKTL